MTADATLDFPGRFLQVLLRAGSQATDLTVAHGVGDNYSRQRTDVGRETVDEQVRHDLQAHDGLPHVVDVLRFGFAQPAHEIVVGVAGSDSEDFNCELSEVSSRDDGDQPHVDEVRDGHEEDHVAQLARVAVGSGEFDAARDHEENQEVEHPHSDCDRQGNHNQPLLVKNVVFADAVGR